MPSLLYIRSHVQPYPPSLNSALHRHGGVTAVKQYTNSKSDKPLPHLTLVHLEEANWLRTPACEAVMQACAGSEVRVYEVVQEFEGQREKTGHGKLIVAAANEPAKGMDEDFDEWYRKQHLDMLSLVHGYRRSTRYRLTPVPVASTVVEAVSHINDKPAPTSATESSRIAHREDEDEAPRYLALHEFDDEHTIDWETLRMCARTEWSKRVVGGYRRMERDDWILNNQNII